jgi:hypothetical protein
MSTLSNENKVYFPNTCSIQFDTSSTLVLVEFIASLKNFDAKIQDPSREDKRVKDNSSSK